MKWVAKKTEHGWKLVTVDGSKCSEFGSCRNQETGLRDSEVEGFEEAREEVPERNSLLFGQGSSHPLAKSASRMGQPEAGDRGKDRHVFQNREEVGHGLSRERPEPGDPVPFIYAVADTGERWWEELRGDPKRLGEVSQAAFLLKARSMGFSVAIPWGDSDPNDFLVWARDAREGDGGSSPKIFRVQVKGTGRLYRRGYEVQPVRSTRRKGKKRYTKKEIDVLVAHVQPVDAWYVIPIEEVGQAKSLRLYPGIKSRNPRWEKWRDRWEVIGAR